jgi:hypothetical protein
MPDISHPSMLLSWGDDKGEVFGLTRMLRVPATVWKHRWGCWGLAGHFIILPLIDAV